MPNGLPWTSNPGLGVALLDRHQVILQDYTFLPPVSGDDTLVQSSSMGTEETQIFVYDFEKRRGSPRTLAHGKEDRW